MLQVNEVKPNDAVKCIRANKGAGLELGEIYIVRLVVSEGKDYTGNTVSGLVVYHEREKENQGWYPCVWDADRFEMHKIGPVDARSPWEK